ncbi:helix-turn-helix transcriptional regulator [Paenibacillus sp. IB182363]|uniref:Helix-turn-helix transcriptional regulator n=2 Tax=Paenibacillus oceani TaxID=2772510 RepID=A0A927C7K7_9BACL|nr:helix-turn-helix transcriptional regulator [Paenibacillus oceani]
MPIATESVKRELCALADRIGSSHDYRSAMLEKLRLAVPFDAACCTTVDPQTHLSTGAVTDESVEAIHHLLFENEYRQDDVNAFESLAASASPAATLSGATGGEPAGSARYRDILRPAGFTDELRAVFVHEGTCWGHLSLYRRSGSPLFREEEVAAIVSLLPCLTDGVRHTNGLQPPAGRPKPAAVREPGIALLSERLELLSANAEADYWLAMLRSRERIGPDTLPRPVRAVCMRAMDGGHTAQLQPPKPQVCLSAPDGQYLTLRASKLFGAAGTGTCQLAVTIEASRPSDILPYMTDAYRLSAREKQVLEGVLRGLSTKELAGSLHISGYTVQDHLKAIFAKTGVTSRRDLIWRLHGRYSLPADGDTAK